MARSFNSYLATRVNRGVRFRCSNPQGLFVFVDSNFDASAVYTGIFVFLGGGCIHSKSLRQKFISTSSFDAEYAGLSEAIKVGCYYRSIARDLGTDIQHAVIFCDNKAVVDCVNSTETYDTSKKRHHRVRAMWSKERRRRGYVQVHWIEGSKNLADLATKPGRQIPGFSELIAQLMGERDVQAMKEFEAKNKM